MGLAKPTTLFLKGGVRLLVEWTQFELVLVSTHLQIGFPNIYASPPILPLAIKICAESQCVGWKFACVGFCQVQYPNLVFWLLDIELGCRSIVDNPHHVLGVGIRNQLVSVQIPMLILELPREVVVAGSCLQASLFRACRQDLLFATR